MHSFRMISISLFIYRNIESINLLVIVSEGNLWSWTDIIGQRDARRFNPLEIFGFMLHFWLEGKSVFTFGAGSDIIHSAKAAQKELEERLRGRGYSSSA